MTNTQLLSAGTLQGDPVINLEGEEIGRVEELMIDLDSGHVGYAVLSFGGFMGMGRKLFAVPWQALTVDLERECLVLDVPKEVLQEAPGFDPDNWPDIDLSMGEELHRHYGVSPYWSSRVPPS